MDQVTKSEMQLFFITIVTLILCPRERAVKSHFVCEVLYCNTTLCAGDAV